MQFQSDAWQRGKNFDRMYSHEIENIVRIQEASLFSKDPYVDDYYYQAMRANAEAAAGGDEDLPPAEAPGADDAAVARRFAPSSVQSMMEALEAGAEQRALQARRDPNAMLAPGTLGRIPISSVRRPKPLVEIDTHAGANTEMMQAKELADDFLGLVDSDAASAKVKRHGAKSLWGEKGVLARGAVEDANNAMLEADDVVRCLHAGLVGEDGGLTLLKHRDAAIDSAYSKLKVRSKVDANGIPVGGAEEDDHFGAVAGTKKGRKLLARLLPVFPAHQAPLVVLSLLRCLKPAFQRIQATHLNVQTAVYRGAGGFDVALTADEEAADDTTLRAIAKAVVEVMGSMPPAIIPLCCRALLLSWLQREGKGVDTLSVLVQQVPVLQVLGMLFALAKPEATKLGPAKLLGDHESELLDVLDTFKDALRGEAGRPGGAAEAKAVLKFCADFQDALEE